MRTGFLAGAHSFCDTFDCLCLCIPKTGESDVTIHRMCLQSKDEISIFLMPGARHIGYFRELAEAAGEPLPISVSRRYP